MIWLTIKRLPKILFIWPYQRMVRGFSDADTWSFDLYLSQVIADGVKQLRKNTHSYPSELTEESWEAILREMEEGFAMAADQGWLFTPKFEESVECRKVNRALDLFRQYYFDLWD